MKISSGYGVRGSGVLPLPSVPEAPVQVYVNAAGVPTIPKADVDRYRAKGMPVKWYGPTAPTAGHGAVNGDRYLDAVLTLGGGGGPTNITVTYSGSSWSHTKAQVDAARATGGTVSWSTTSVAPTVANGLAVGDIVTSSAPLAPGSAMNPNTPITIQPAWAPAAYDGQGTTNDTVTLTKVTGVTWTVDGTQHATASFTGATKVVPYTKGVDTTVTATVESGYEFVGGTTSWTLTFTNYTPAAGMLTSTDFSNLTAGVTTFTENEGSGVPFTFNNAFGGSQTSGSAKYCSSSPAGGFILQNSGSYWAHAAPAIATNVTMEWTHKGNSGTGDTFFFPMYKGSTGTGWGARVTSAGLLGTGKIVSWTVGSSGITYTSGSAPTLAANDSIKLVATSTTMTAFVNDVQVWAYNFASQTDNNTAQIQVGTTSGTSYTLDDYKFSTT